MVIHIRLRNLHNPFKWRDMNLGQGTQWDFTKVDCYAPSGPWLCSVKILPKKISQPTRKLDYLRIYYVRLLCYPIVTFITYQIVLTKLSLTKLSLDILVSDNLVSKQFLPLPNCHLPNCPYQNVTYQNVAYQNVTYQIYLTKNPPVMYIYLSFKIDCLFAHHIGANIYFFSIHNSI